MKNIFIYIVLVIIILFSNAFSYEKPLNTVSTINRIFKVDEGLYFIYFDSTIQKRHITKGTIVEFKDYLVLIEMSITDHKRSSDTLFDHFEDCQRALESIQAYFPNKPLKYVLSSHWHPHSLSSINPLITKGINVVTTKLNYERLKEFVDSATFDKYRNNFIFVEDNSFSLKDEYNEIRAYKINRENYPSLPTSDFLFFYIPKYQSLHVSCMFQRFRNSKVLGKEYISPRTEDVSRFMNSQNIEPKSFISIDPYADEKNGFILADTLNAMLRNGILPSSIEQYLIGLTDDDVMKNTDSLIKYFMQNLIPRYLIIQTIYKLLEKQDISKSLKLAKFNSILFPSDPNSWDTLAEVYFFSGEKILARKYAAESKNIDPKFKGGNELTWQENLDKHIEKWKLLPTK